MEDHLGPVHTPAGVRAAAVRAAARRTDGVVSEMTHGVPTALGAADISFYHVLFSEAGVAQEAVAEVDGSWREPRVG
ncbi:MAG: hypothetical protein E6J71_15380 [Deltaproteobacteria bacterium]|nr:MAG: hypothetical protein E6J71_15380 [Deltaproteobacteria bacterium]